MSTLANLLEQVSAAASAEQPLRIVGGDSKVDAISAASIRVLTTSVIASSIYSVRSYGMRPFTPGGSCATMSGNIPRICRLTVSALAPGIIHTAMMDRLCDEGDAGRFPALQRLRQARGTDAMPGPEAAAERVLSVLPALRARLTAVGRTIVSCYIAQSLIFTVVFYAALFLASRAADFVNGHVLYVDGGIRANFGYVKGENELP